MSGGRSGWADAEWSLWHRAIADAGADYEALVERAAIYEYEGGLTRQEAEREAVKWYRAKRLQGARPNG